jgi:predicted metalloprotease
VTIPKRLALATITALCVLFTAACTPSSIVQHVGDEYSTVRDHGSRKNHGYWSLRAFDAGNPSACNTFTAPAKRVS